MALCRLSQNSDAAARDAVRKGIDLMIPSLAKAAPAEAIVGVSGAITVAGVPLEAAADSFLSKDSSASAAAGSSGTAAPVQLASSPSYARYLKRVLSEDGHATSTLVHVLQIIVRNRDLFYPTR